MPKIIRIETANNRYQIESGNIESLLIWGIDEQGNSHENISSLVECFVIEGEEYSLKIFAGCQVAALIPGRAKIRVQFDSGSQEESIGIDIEITVTPRNISPASNIIDIELQDWQSELWLSVPGLKYRDNYRATMNGFLPNGTVLDIIPNFNDFKSVCRNRVPVNATKVACYFQPDDNLTIFVVKNTQQRLFTAQVFIENIREIDQAAVSYYAEQAVPVILDLAVSEYVFANESSINNSHYFRFKRMNPPIPVKVVLTYSHLISLDVAWQNGVCTTQMLEVTANRTSCTVPITASGELMIKIEGNNGTNLANAPAAVEGGSQYELVVETVL